MIDTIVICISIFIVLGVVILATYSRMKIMAKKDADVYIDAGIIKIPGTASIGDWFANILSIFKKPIYGPEGKIGYVSFGGWIQTQQIIKWPWLRYLFTWTESRIDAHSLGAMNASILILEILKNNRSVKIEANLYGGLCGIDKSCAEFINSCPNVDITWHYLDTDPVPVLSNLFWSHPGRKSNYNPFFKRKWNRFGDGYLFGFKFDLTSKSGHMYYDWR